MLTSVEGDVVGCDDLYKLRSLYNCVGGRSGSTIEDALII